MLRYHTQMLVVVASLKTNNIYSNIRCHESSLRMLDREICSIIIYSIYSLPTPVSQGSQWMTKFPFNNIHKLIKNN